MSKNDTIGATVCAMAGMNPKFVKLVRDVANRLSGPDTEASAWFEYINQAIQQGLPVPAPPPLFAQMFDLDEHPFPGSDAFYFDDYFTTEPKFGMKQTFSYVGPNVKTWLGGMQVLATQPSRLTLDRLTRREYDTVIIAQIGEENCDLHLGEVRWLFESGLLVQGRYYACYVRDIQGVRRALYWDWRGDGWHVDADEGPYVIRWDAGGEFVSRKRSVA